MDKTTLTGIILYWSVSLILFCFSPTKLIKPKSIRNVLVNQIVFQCPLSMLCVHYWHKDIEQNNWIWLPIQGIFCYQWYSFMFYWGHRIIHHRFFYKRIHSIHHIWVKTEAYSAFDAHPIEHILCNLLPLISGMYIIKLPVDMINLFAGLGTLFALQAHDPNLGYDHLVHHIELKYNYGVDSFFDKIFGTYKSSEMYKSPEPESKPESKEQTI